MRKLLLNLSSIKKKQIKSLKIMDKSLSLSEKLFVLSVNSEKGGIIQAASAVINHILTGALMLELVQNKNAVIVNGRLKVIDNKSNNSLHRFLLGKLNKKKNHLKLSQWLGRLSLSHNYIRREIQSRLVRKGIIRMEQKSFLFFRWKKPVLIRKKIAVELNKEIESQIFSGKGYEMEVMLLSLLKPSGLLKTLFPEKEKRKKATLFLDQMKDDNQVSKEVSDAIATAQAVAVTVTTIAASSAARGGR